MNDDSNVIRLYEDEPDDAQAPDVNRTARRVILGIGLALAGWLALAVIVAVVRLATYRHLGH